MAFPSSIKVTILDNFNMSMYSHFTRHDMSCVIEHNRSRVVSSFSYYFGSIKVLVDLNLSMHYLPTIQDI